MKLRVTVLAVAACAAGAQAQLFGVAGFSAFGTQSLYSIDSATGAATLIGDTGLRQIADIAYSPQRSTLYALTVGADLYSINLATGASSLVAARAGVTTEGALAFQPGTGGLFAITDDTLATVDLATANLATISALNVDDNDVSGMAFSLAGELFAYAKNGTLEDSILRVDPISGLTTRIGLTGFSSSASVGGLAFDGAGTMFLSDGDALYTVNRLTGELTLIGAHGAANFSGLTFVPSPGALALAVVAGLVAARRRR